MVGTIGWGQTGASRHLSASLGPPVPARVLVPEKLMQLRLDPTIDGHTADIVEIFLMILVGSLIRLIVELFIIVLTCLNHQLEPFLTTKSL